MAKAEKLNPKEELFCQLYAGDSEFFGNATRAYFGAYNLSGKQLSSAAVLSVRLLGKVKIKNRVNYLLDKEIDNKTVDRELARVIKQNDELSAKVAAIREYNRVKQRVDDSPKFPLFAEPDAKTKALIEKRFNTNIRKVNAR